MVLTDPPDHTRLRGLVNKAFTPRVVESMRPHIQQIIDGLLDTVQPRGRMDFLREFAFPLPATVIMELLGVSPSDRDQLKVWSDSFVVFFSTHPAQIAVEQYLEAQKSMEEMHRYFKAAAARVRQDQRDCLLLLLERAEEQGHQLSEEELIANAQLMLVAGHETTTNLIGNGMLALLRHPGLRDQLQGHPELIPGAVEEFLRFDGPVQFTNRIARENVVLGDKNVAAGDLVFLFLAAANRDPAHFPAPDRLDIMRDHQKHLAFGLGHHFCLGAPLARLEAQLAFATILKRFPNLKLESDRLDYRENFNLHGLERLPVSF
jgi:hypothetical protein